VKGDVEGNKGRGEKRKTARLGVRDMYRGE
jgi:hypothetical protein